MRVKISRTSEFPMRGAVCYENGFLPIDYFSFSGPHFQGISADNSLMDFNYEYYRSRPRMVFKAELPYRNYLSLPKFTLIEHALMY
jgi:hypothetical protein